MKTLFPQQLDEFNLPQTALQRNEGVDSNSFTVDDIPYLLDAIEKKLGVDNSPDGSSLSGRMATLEASFAATAGLTAALDSGSANQIFGMDGSGNAQEWKTLNGTANQITITHAAGSITFSLPNTIIASTDASLSLNSGWAASKINLDDGEINYHCDLHSFRTYAGTLIASLSGTLASGLVYANSSSVLSQVTNVATGSVLVSGTPPSYTALGDILGTANQVTVTGGADKIVGADVTLSLPQNIHTAATPQFAKLGLGAAAGTNVLEVTGNTLGTGYLRVGSLTAPANATAGDLTATRLSIGNTAFATAGVHQIEASGSVDQSNQVRFAKFAQTFTPTADDTSGTTRVVLELDQTFNGSFNYTRTLAGILSYIRFQNSGTVSGTMIGGIFEGFRQGSGGSNFTSLTTTEGIRAMSVNSFGAKTGTVTTGHAIHIVVPTLNAATLTNSRGLTIDSLTGGTNNTHILLGTGTTGNWGLYSSLTVDNYLNGNLGLAVTPTERLHVSGNAIITSSIYQDDIPKPYITVGGDAQGRTFTVAVKKFNNTATAYTRYVVSWWVSTSQDGAPSKPSNQTVAVGNGAGSGAQTLSGTPNTPTWCVAETDSAGEVKITVSNTQTGTPATVYFHCEVLGARFTASGTVNTAVA